MLLEGERTEHASMSLFASKHAEVARLLLTCSFIPHAPASLPNQNPGQSPNLQRAREIQRSGLQEQSRAQQSGMDTEHRRSTCFLCIYADPCSKVTKSLNVTRMVHDVLGQTSLFPIKLASFASEVWIWIFSHSLNVWSLCFQHCLGSLWDLLEVEPHWRKQVTEGRVLRFYNSTLLSFSPYFFTETMRLDAGPPALPHWTIPCWTLSF